MNKDKILKEILNNKDLREKYWSSIDVNKLNINTLLRENNKYLSALYFLFEEKNRSKFTYMITNIKKTFEL